MKEFYLAPNQLSLVVVSGPSKMTHALFCRTLSQNRKKEVMETSYTNKNRSSIVLAQEPEIGEMHRRKKRPSSEVKCTVDKARGRVEEREPHLSR